MLSGWLELVKLPAVVACRAREVAVLNLVRIWRQVSESCCSQPSVAHDGDKAMGLCGLNATPLAPRVARQPPRPSSRAAASLPASAEPWAPPKVPRLLSRPRGSKAPWESPSLKKPVAAAAGDRLPPRSRARFRRRQLSGPASLSHRLRPSATPPASRGFRYSLAPCLAFLRPCALRSRFPAATCASPAVSANAVSLSDPLRREPSSPITPSAPSPDASAAQRPPRLPESAHQPPARRSLPSCLESMQTRMIASPAQGPRKPFPFGFACG